MLGVIPLVRYPSKLSETLYAASAASKACVNGPESLKSWAMAAKDQFQAAACLHQPCSQIHEFLHHGFDPTPFGRMAHRGMPIDKSDLPDETQDIVRQSAQGQDQGVGGEFARREPFHVQIGLDLAMELFTRSMVFVESDYLLHRQIQSGPPSFDLNFRDEEPLSKAVDGALHCTHHPFELIGLPFMDLADMDSEQPNSFPRSRRDNFTLFENSIRPFDLVFSSGIPLDDIADILFALPGQHGYPAHHGPNPGAPGAFGK